jgi:hypothetical protein
MTLVPARGTEGTTRVRWHLAFVILLIGIACQPTADRESPRRSVGAELAVGDAGCGYDSVRPATGAPAEGLWVYEDRLTFHRVAAMVGPAQTSPGIAQLTRRVETLESRSGADTIRHTSDTASVRLELVPPFARPAAVYPVSPFVLLASYEPCSPGPREPLVRYLRKDAQGQVATDVLLQREATP